MTPSRVSRSTVVLVGASSLRGRELKELLGESLAGGNLRLLDDEAAGTLTEAGGEPALILPFGPDSFHGAQLVFFAGNQEFTRRHWGDARRAGATVIDASGGLAEAEGAVPWIPALDATLTPPRWPQAQQGGVYVSPSPACIITCTLVAALAPFCPRRMVLTFFEPASERGQAGIEELEQQTVHLLSFQVIPQQVYDAQVAFNLLSRYGAASRVNLGELRDALAAEVARYLAGRLAVPALQLVQAPVFYSYAWSAFLELDEPRLPAELEAVLVAAGVVRQGSPSNVSAAGESRILLGPVERDATLATGYWLWGVADNIRLAAANAVAIAERLRAS